MLYVRGLWVHDMGGKSNINHRHLLQRTIFEHLHNGTPYMNICCILDKSKNLTFSPKRTLGRLRLK